MTPNTISTNINTKKMFKYNFINGKYSNQDNCNK